MKLRAYPRYRDSGIEWLGEIPEHWEVKKLKYLARIQTGNTPPRSDPNNYDENGIPWIKPDDLGNFIPVSSSSECLSPQGAKLGRLIPQDAVLVCCIGSVGKMGIAGCTLATNQQINAVVFNHQELKPKYGRYIMFAASEEHTRLSNTNVVSILSGEVQKNILLPDPPIPEQRAIAAFLDRETARIDTLIEKKERQIELLQEKRAALISHAVTKGLNPNVKMKDSGIEWLGKIPEHWEVIRLKFAAQIVMGQSPDSNDYLYDSVGLPFLQGNAEFSQKHPVPRLICNTAAKVAPAGALLISVRAPVGALNIADREYGIGRGLCAVIPRPIVLDQRYSWYLLQVIRKGLFSAAKGSTYDAVTADEVAGLRGVIPPPHEQRAIATFLDRETARIDLLIEKIRKSMDLLREYRTALISAAVTGKIDVRGIV